MPTADRPPRIAVALLARAARRWPAEVREQSHRAWLADLHELTADPDTGRWARTWRALRFGASLAVRRPAPSALPIAASPRPALQLFGAALGLTIFGTLAVMLLVHLPAAVADRLPDPDPGDAVHRFPLLAMAPALIAAGVLAGRLLARRDAAAGVTRTVAVILAGWCCAQLLPIFGGALTALPGLALWAVGLWGAAHLIVRLARRPLGPLPWIATAVAIGTGVLALADLAVVSAVWLGVGGGDAPHAYALSWFPGALLDPAVQLPMGTDTGGDPVHGIIVDVVELLPHALLIVSAFTLSYVYAAATRPAEPRGIRPEPA